MEAQVSQDREEWRGVFGSGGRYEVSDLGRVRSMFDNRGRRLETPKLLRQFDRRKGYPGVGLTLAPGARVRFFSVHTLVLEAFVGARPEGSECAHGNGNIRDNRPVNLRWATSTENQEDRRRHGTLPIGEKHPNAKLTAESVLAIRAANLRQVTRRALARRFGVSMGTISQVRAGTIWKEA